MEELSQMNTLNKRVSPPCSLPRTTFVYSNYFMSVDKMGDKCGDIYFLLAKYLQSFERNRKFTTSHKTGSALKISLPYRREGRQNFLHKVRCPKKILQSFV